jgi:endo-1,4-beta-xylanase
MHRRMRIRATAGVLTAAALVATGCRVRPPQTTTTTSRPATTATTATTVTTRSSTTSTSTTSTSTTSTTRPPTPTGGLRDVAAGTGKYIGSAAMAGPLRSDATYRQISAREFDMLTPGNEMKWDATEPTRGQFRYTGADEVVAAAKAANQRVRGHTLVWHSQLPSWVRDGNFTRDDLIAAMNTHIDNLAGRYRGQLYAWDVVNEPFEENGNRRNNKFQQVIGDDYIALAFARARAADPTAKLYINDYNTDGSGAKSNAMYNLVRTLKQQGVPIDGVGFQGHLILGHVPGDVRQNLERFAALGVDVAFTEVDIRMQLPPDASKLARQADDYRKVTDACLAVPRCVGLTVWDFTDKYSWVPSVFGGQGAALPFDENYQPKPAYAALRSSYEAAPGR